jgi:hypothetical protein
MLNGFVCVQCGNFYTTPPLVLTEYDNLPVCSKGCQEGYERFMETVEYYESPTEQLELPFVAP